MIICFDCVVCGVTLYDISRMSYKCDATNAINIANIHYGRDTLDLMYRLIIINNNYNIIKRTFTHVYFLIIISRGRDHRMHKY